MKRPSKSHQAQYNKKSVSLPPSLSIIRFVSDSLTYIAVVLRFQVARRRRCSAGSETVRSHASTPERRGQVPLRMCDGPPSDGRNRRHSRGRDVCPLRRVSLCHVHRTMLQADLTS